MFNLLFLFDPKNLFSELKSGSCYIVFTFQKHFVRTAAVLPVLACPSCFLLRRLIVLFPINYFKTPFDAPKWISLLSSRVSHYQIIWENKLSGKSLSPDTFPTLDLPSLLLVSGLWTPSPLPVEKPLAAPALFTDTSQFLQWLQTRTGTTPERAHPCTPHLLSVPSTHGLCLKSFPAETVTLCSAVVLRSRLLPFSASSGIMKDFPDSI